MDPFVVHILLKGLHVPSTLTLKKSASLFERIVCLWVCPVMESTHMSLIMNQLDSISELVVPSADDDTSSDSP